MRLRRTPVIVLAHNAKPDAELGRSGFRLYHVAVEVDGVLFDARGRIARDNDVLAFMNPQPEATIERFELDNDVKGLIRRHTKWNISFEKYANEASRLLKESGVTQNRRPPAKR